MATRKPQKSILLVYPKCTYCVQLPEGSYLSSLTSSKVLERDAKSDEGQQRILTAQPTASGTFKPRNSMIGYGNYDGRLEAANFVAITQRWQGGMFQALKRLPIAWNILTLRSCKNSQSL